MSGGWSGGFLLGMRSIMDLSDISFSLVGLMIGVLAEWKFAIVQRICRRTDRRRAMRG